MKKIMFFTTLLTLSVNNIYFGQESEHEANLPKVISHEMKEITQRPKDSHQESMHEQNQAEPHRQPTIYDHVNDIVTISTDKKPESKGIFDSMKKTATNLWHSAQRLWNKFGYSKTEADYVSTALTHALHGDPHALDELKEYDVKKNLQPLTLAQKQQILDTAQKSFNELADKKDKATKIELQKSYQQLIEHFKPMCASAQDKDGNQEDTQQIFVGKTATAIVDYSLGKQEKQKEFTLDLTQPIDSQVNKFLQAQTAQLSQDDLEAKSNSIFYRAIKTHHTLDKADEELKNQITNALLTRATASLFDNIDDKNDQALQKIAKKINSYSQEVQHWVMQNLEELISNDLIAQSAVDSTDIDKARTKAQQIANKIQDAVTSQNIQTDEPRNPLPKLRQQEYHGDILPDIEPIDTTKLHNDTPLTTMDNSSSKEIANNLIALESNPEQLALQFGYYLFTGFITPAHNAEWQHFIAQQVKHDPKLQRTIDQQIQIITKFNLHPGITAEKIKENYEQAKTDLNFIITNNPYHSDRKKWEQDLAMLNSQYQKIQDFIAHQPIEGTLADRDHEPVLGTLANPSNVYDYGNTQGFGYLPKPT